LRMAEEIGTTMSEMPVMRMAGFTLGMGALA